MSEPGSLGQTGTSLIYSSASLHHADETTSASARDQTKYLEEGREKQNCCTKNLESGWDDLTISDTRISTKFPGISPWNDRYIFSALNSAATARSLLAIACGGFLSWLDQWLLLILMLCVWITCHKLLQAGFASIWSRAAAAKKHLRQSRAEGKQSKPLMARLVSTNGKEQGNLFNCDNEEDERERGSASVWKACRAS